MLKVATDLVKVKEVVESKFTTEQLDHAEYVLRTKAVKNHIPYITYLGVIGREKELPASARLLAIYLLYIY